MDTLGASRCFQGRFKEAKELHEKAIDGMTRTLGPEHEDTLVAVDNLGRVMWRYFCYDEAKELHWRAMTGMKKFRFHTFAHPNCDGKSRHDISPGRKGRAFGRGAQADGRSPRTAPEQTGQGTAIHSASHLQPRSNSALGGGAEAEQMMRAALPIAERNLGENHLGTLAGHLAQVLVRQ